MSFRLVPKSMTLDDLERRNGRYFSEFAYLPGVLRRSSRSLSHLLMSSCIALVTVCCCRFLYVALFGSEEIRVYSIRDDKKITFNNVSFLRITLSTQIVSSHVHRMTTFC